MSTTLSLVPLAQHPENPLYFSIAVSIYKSIYIFYISIRISSTQCKIIHTPITLPLDTQDAKT